MDRIGREEKHTGVTASASLFLLSSPKNRLVGDSLAILDWVAFFCVPASTPAIAATLLVFKPFTNWSNWVYSVITPTRRRMGTRLCLSLFFFSRRKDVYVSVQNFQVESKAGRRVGREKVLLEVEAGKSILAVFKASL